VNQGTTTGDVPDCGEETKKCKTIGNTVTRWHRIPNQNIIPSVQTYLENKEEIDRGTLILLSPTSTQPSPTNKSTATTGSLFPPGNGSVKMSFFTLLHNTPVSLSLSLSLTRKAHLWMI
jgi:hypothetical protein